MSAAIASPRPTRCTRPAASASQMPTWLAWIAGREGGSGAMAAMLGTREERGKGGTRQGRKGLEAPHSSKERKALLAQARSEEHTSELQSLMRISYAVFCLKKKNSHNPPNTA